MQQDLLPLQSLPMDAPLIDSMVWIPYSWLNKRTGKALCNRLTVKPKSFGKEERSPIEAFVAYTEGRMLGIPYRFGLDWLAERGYIPAASQFYLSSGSPITPARLPDPFFDTEKFPHQDVFFNDMITAARDERCFLAEAPTRTGKTPTALNMIGTLAMTAIIILPSTYLANQWRLEITKHLGIEEDQIGIVEGGKCVWEGKSIVVAVIHNLVEIKWPEEFYRYFGITVWDEAHRVGARQFSESLKQFPSLVKVAMTATPKRRDGCEQIFLDYFGSPLVVSHAEAMACDCIVLEYQRRGKTYNPKIPLPVLLNILANDAERNQLIAFTAYTLYKTGREGFLIVSDRVDQLQALQALTIAAGVPREETGLFTRTYVDAEGKEKTFKQSDLDLVKANASVIFATYGMMKDGVDIPRLDSGMDATPRAEGTQMIGRIRTPKDGKRKPVWFTIKDIGVPRLLRQFEARLKDYRSSNVTVKQNQ